MKKIFLAVLAATAMMPSSSPTLGNQDNGCRKRTELLAHLEKKFQEAPVARGVADSGVLLEVFSSPDGETWTAALTMPNGITCLIASGKSWENIPRMAQFGPPI